MTTEPTPQQVLNLELAPDNDSGTTTVRGYLTALLSLLWEHDEGFSGKKPFGSSDWQDDLYIPMMRAGFITGELGKDGDVREMDTRTGDRLIQAAIKHLGAS